MMERSYRAEKIINKIREAKVLLSQGCTVAEATERIGVNGQTHYLQRREYGGIIN